MDCLQIEERLSDYLESSLSDLDREQVIDHLSTCSNCSALLSEMRSTIASCQSFPQLEMDRALMERILLRTSGRSRTRNLRELLSHYLLQPIFAPRFAAGSVLVALLAILFVNVLLSPLTAATSAMSPSQLFRQIDRGVQQIYSEGVKVYDKKNIWQAQITFYKNSMLNRLGFMIEQLDMPVEGQKKPMEPYRPTERVPNDKRSMLLFPA